MTTPLMLPGQAAAPAGPADMTMMYVLHHAFRRDLADFGRIADVVGADDRVRWALIERRWGRFTHELHQHHTKEDEILWPLLLERVRAAGDAAAERVLHEMEEEHAVLDPALITVSAAMVDLAAGADEARRTVVRDGLGQLRESLDHHLGHEESAAIEILQRHVGGDEWAEIERTRFRPKQTLEQARFFVPWALKGLEPEVQHRVLSFGGPALRVILAMSRRRFRLDEEAVFAVRT